MSDKETEKKGVVRFEEGLNPFLCWDKENGFRHEQRIAVVIILDGKEIGYITSDGKITNNGTITEGEPTRIMSYSNTFTLEQWDEIGAKAREFKEKCAAAAQEKKEET